MEVTYKKIIKTNTKNMNSPEGGFMGKLARKAKEFKLAAGLATGLGIMGAGAEAAATEKPTNQRVERVEKTKINQEYVNDLKKRFISRLKQAFPDEKKHNIIINGLERSLHRPEIDTPEKQIEVITIYVEKLSKELKNKNKKEKDDEEIKRWRGRIENNMDEAGKEMESGILAMHNFLDPHVKFEDAMGGLADITKEGGDIEYNGIEIHKKNNKYYWGENEINPIVRNQIIEAYRKATAEVSKETGATF